MIARLDFASFPASRRFQGPFKCLLQNFHCLCWFSVSVIARLDSRCFPVLQMTSSQGARHFWISVFVVFISAASVFVVASFDAVLRLSSRSTTGLCTTSISGASPLALDISFRTWLPNLPPDLENPYELVRFVAYIVLTLALSFDAQHHFPMAWTAARNDVDPDTPRRLRFCDCVATSFYLVDITSGCIHEQPSTTSNRLFLLLPQPVQTFTGSQERSSGIQYGDAN